MTVADPLRAARRAVRSAEFTRAAEVLDAAAPAARTSPEWALLAAIARWRLGEFRISRRLAEQARDGFRQRADGDGEMRSENVAAAGAFALGALTDAEQGFDRARRLAEARGDALLASRCANNLGNVAFYRSEHDQALAFYRLAAAGFERLGFDHGLAEAWVNQSIVARDVSDLVAAREHAERALQVAERAGSLRVVAQAHANIGEALAGLGDARLGRVHLHRALALARREYDRLALVEALRLLAVMEARAGNVADARAYWTEAADALQQLEHPFMRGELLRDRAAFERTRGDPAVAQQLAREAAAAFARAGAEVRARDVRG